MKFQFDTVEEYDLMWECVVNAILYWKKVRQDAQGKICLQVNGAQTTYNEQYAIDQMVTYGQLLQQIEDTPHPEWNGSSYQMSSPGFYSHMVEKCLKLAKGEVES